MFVGEGDPRQEGGLAAPAGPAGPHQAGSAEPLRGGGPAEPQATGRPDLTELPLERLEHEITRLAAQVNAGTCRWLELVGEFDRREGWARSWGVRSCAEWVAWQCGLMPRAAREHVRVARALPELPATHAAFARGELSYSKVRALTRIAAPESESELLALARNATAAQLERIVRGVRRISAEDANELHERRNLSVSWEPDGSLSIHGSLPPEQGALFMRALEAARDALHERSPERPGSAEPEGDQTSAEPHGDLGSAEPQRQGGAGEPRPVPGEDPPPELSWRSNADALTAMADASLAAPNAERPGAERYQVLVHVDAEGQPILADGSALAPETVRRIACDAAIVRLRSSPGSESELSVGRRTRSVPPALRRALEARDPGCRFPGCDRTRFLDHHHIRHWAAGGETSASNLVRLCGHHHRLLHEGGYSLSVAPDGTLAFRRPGGSPLANSPRPPAADPRDLERRIRGAGLELGPGTLAGGTGEPLDLDWTLATWPRRLRPRPDS